jgi:hypothetical protein
MMIFSEAVPPVLPCTQRHGPVTGASQTIEGRFSFFT